MLGRDVIVAERARLLVVEDSRTQADYARIVLETAGFEVAVAGDAGAATGSRCVGDGRRT